jgi:hypothetical protein
MILRSFAMRFLTLAFALLPLSAACSRQAPDSSVTQVKEPDDPLADKVRTLSAGQVMIERTRSEPAGPDGDSAKYQWAILARVSLADVAIPAQLLVEGTKPNGLGWSIVRVTAHVQFEKQFDDTTRGKQGEFLPKPGKRHVSVRITGETTHWMPGFCAGHLSSGGMAIPGGVMTLDHNEWPGAVVKGGFTPLSTGKVLVEVDKVPLDDLVKLLFQGPETLSPPRTLELLQVKDHVTNLELVK